MDLNWLSLSTLVLEAPFYVFYTTTHQIFWRFDADGVVFVSSLIWYHTHRQTRTRHPGTKRLKNACKYNLTTPVMCTRQLPALHWMNNLLIQKCTLQRSTILLHFKYYSLDKQALSSCRIHISVTKSHIRFNKTQCFLRNTKKTDRNGIIEQKTHTTHREKDKFRKGQLVLFSDTTFFRTTPLFYETLNYYGTILNAPFLGKVRKLKLPSPSLSGMRGGLQLWLPHPPTQILGN